MKTHRVTISSSRDASIEPLLMAVVRLSPQISEEGITISRPALAAAMPACCAPQSVITYPILGLKSFFTVQQLKADQALWVLTLKAQLRLEQPIQRLAILTAVRVIDALIRAHNGRATRKNCILEWPKVKLVHRLVINVR